MITVPNFRSKNRSQGFARVFEVFLITKKSLLTSSHAAPKSSLGIPHCRLPCGGTTRPGPLATGPIWQHSVSTCNALSYFAERLLRHKGGAARVTLDSPDKDEPLIHS